VTATNTEDITILEMVDDHEIACELGTNMTDECPNTAKWVMFRKSGMCGCVGLPPALACDSCKDSRMSSEGAVVCVFCRGVIAPARHGYARIEPL